MQATGKATPDAATLIRRWFDEVWNKGMSETIDELFPEHAVMWGVGRPEESSKGPAVFKEFYRAMRSACPDMQIVLNQVVQQGHGVCAMDRNHDEHRRRIRNARNEPEDRDPGYVRVPRARRSDRGRLEQLGSDWHGAPIGTAARSGGRIVPLSKLDPFPALGTKPGPSKNKKAAEKSAAFCIPW